MSSKGESSIHLVCMDGGISYFFFILFCFFHPYGWIKKANRIYPASAAQLSQFSPSQHLVGSLPQKEQRAQIKLEWLPCFSCELSGTPEYLKLQRWVRKRFKAHFLLKICKHLNVLILATVLLVRVICLFCFILLVHTGNVVLETRVPCTLPAPRFKMYCTCDLQQVLVLHSKRSVFALNHMVQ